MEDIVLKLVIYLAPMYFANSSAMLFGGKTPLDLGKKMPDGQPIFGNGKTLRGTFMGIVVGSLITLGVYLAMPQATLLLTDNYIALGVFLSIGAITGDVIASYFKRRNKIKQGAPVLFLDQLDFVFGGMILGSFFFVPNFFEILIISIATLIVHHASNIFAFKTKLKKVPW